MIEHNDESENESKRDMVNKILIMNMHPCDYVKLQLNMFAILST